MMARAVEPWLAAVTITALGACATTSPTDPTAGLEPLASELAAHDVVFLGEIHDNDVLHVQHAQLLRLLHGERPELVLSLEMFERDVQAVLDDYLAGLVGETEFLERSRPWRRYARHYRPMLEFCREHGLPVVAANLPRELAARVSREGLGALDGSPWAPRATTAPRDAYWRAFRAAMADHSGGAADRMFRFYQAQCAKDDAMAESIVDAIRAGDPRPLVVHVAGRFHVADRHGTVMRVLSRMPELDVAVVDSEPRSNVERDGGDFVLVVPPQPEAEEPRPEPDTAADADH